MKSEEYVKMKELENSHFWYRGMRDVLRSLVSSLELPPKARILDAGCGTGGNMMFLGQFGQIEGIDISEQAVKVCKDRGLIARKLDVQNLDEHEKYDLVYCFEMLYHEYVKDDMLVVGNLARALRPGGWLIVKEPALEILRRGHDHAVMTRKRYTKDELKMLFEENGVEVRRLTYLNFLLFPFVLASKLLVKSRSDLQEMGWMTNRVLGTVMGIEAKVVRWIDFPIGSSVLCIGQKLNQPSNHARISSRNRKVRLKKSKNTRKI